MEWLIENWKELTLSGVLGIAIWGLVKQWWVIGWMYREKIAELDKKDREIEMWRSIALEGHDINKKTVNMTEKIMGN